LFGSFEVKRFLVKVYEFKRRTFYLSYSVIDMERSNSVIDMERRKRSYFVKRFFDTSAAIQ
jgi:hypothetical protein